MVFDNLWPAQNPELLDLCCDKGATVIAMDMVPRISRAQKMDSLLHGEHRRLPRRNRGRQPLRPLLHWLGHRQQGSTSLGAITYAFDVCPEVAEQIEFIGAQFVFLDFNGVEEPEQAFTSGDGEALRRPLRPSFDNARCDEA